MIRFFALDHLNIGPAQFAKLWHEMLLVSQHDLYTHICMPSFLVLHLHQKSFDHPYNATQKSIQAGLILITMHVHIVLAGRSLGNGIRFTWIDALLIGITNEIDRKSVV